MSRSDLVYCKLAFRHFTHGLVAIISGELNSGGILHTSQIFCPSFSWVKEGFVVLAIIVRHNYATTI